MLVTSSNRQPVSRRRRIGSIAAIAAALAALALLGRSGDSLSLRAALAQASTRTTAAGSFHVSFTLAAGEFTAKGSGEVDTRSRRGRLQMTAELPPGMTVPEGGASWTTETIYDERYIFIRVPGLQDAFPEANRWLRAELSEMPGGGSAELFSGIYGASYSPLHDPRGLLEFLRATSGDVETIGDEKVGSVATTHYRAVVSLEAVVARTVGARRQVLEREFESLRESALPTS